MSFQRPEMMLILPAATATDWRSAVCQPDPENVALRLAGCLRDLDSIQAHLAAAYVETAILHLRSWGDDKVVPPDDCSESE
jgi:hypothetical protein